MSELFDERASFAQLRSLMNRAKLDKAAQRELWALVQSCAALNTNAYKSHWLTYMQGFPHHWTINAMTLSSLKELAHACALLPFGRFSLNMQASKLADADLKEIAKHKALSQVSWLYLSTNTISDKGAMALATSPHLGALQELYLNRNQIGNEGARALADSPHCNGLITLDLQINQIRDAGAMALANSPHLTGLKTLYLSSNQIELEGARALARSTYLGGDSLATRATLYIDHNPIGPLGIEALISSRAINLRGNLRNQLATEDW